MLENRKIKENWHVSKLCEKSEKKNKDVSMLNRKEIMSNMNCLHNYKYVGGFFFPILCACTATQICFVRLTPGDGDNFNMKKYNDQLFIWVTILTLVLISE